MRITRSRRSARRGRHRRPAPHDRPRFVPDGGRRGLGSGSDPRARAPPSSAPGSPPAARSSAAPAASGSSGCTWRPTSGRAWRDPDDEVYRVTVAGRFPPRPLRYVVRAGGRPRRVRDPAAPTSGAVIAITTDDRVLTEPHHGPLRGPGPARTRRGPEARRGARAAAHPRPVRRHRHRLRPRRPRLPARGAGRPDRARRRGLPPHRPDGGAVTRSCCSCTATTARATGATAPVTRGPAGTGWQPIPNDEGYGYLGSRLASFGYIVVSVSGNGVNVLGNTVDDTGMRQRGLLLAAAPRALGRLEHRRRRPVRRDLRRRRRHGPDRHHGPLPRRRGRRLRRARGPAAGRPVRHRRRAAARARGLHARRRSTTWRSA